MIQNKLFRQCLAAVPEEQKAEFELSFGIAERGAPDKPCGLGRADANPKLLLNDT